MDPADRLRLTVVASAAAYTRRGGHASSCYLLELGDSALVLDLGQGAFAALGEIRAPESLHAVLISHLHPDHHIDLVPMRHYLRYACDPPARVTLHAPADLRRRYDTLLGEREFLADMPGPDLHPGTFDVGPFRITAAHVTHIDDSFGFRVSIAGVESAPGLAYSGDCGRPDDLVALARPGDTLLCEATWGVKRSVPGAAHLTAQQAGSAARQSGAARLVLTHLLDDAQDDAALDTARRESGGTVVLAQPRMQLVID